MNNQNIIINATAAREVGALSILKQLIDTIPEDQYNYIIFIHKSVTLNATQRNIRFIKKDVTSYFKRLIWDSFGVIKWLKKNNIKPIASISMQNTNFRTGYDIPNFIYYHQSIPFYDHDWSPFNKKERVSWFYKNIYPFFIKIFLNKKTNIFVQLPFIKNGFAKRFNFPKDRIFVISPQFTKPISDEEISIKLDSNKINLFYAASNTEKYKNHKVLFDAIDRLDQDKYTLYVTNNELDFPTVNNPNVIFLGKIAYKQVIEIYKNVDALLFPSYIETFGLPLAEAASLGIKIIASDLSYAKEVLEGYQGAEFAKYNNIDEWVEKIKLIKKNEKFDSLDISKRPSWDYFYTTIKSFINNNNKL